ncbi:hypothetical protein [Chryseobacterium sp.]|uniref:hypothetical protein n=1 Tax=Chryseobacterium sp. TaxID=1871047 RepID=UPI0028981FEB|nr:hypothetical protein [Chryseobacterium sp.]
MISAEQKLQIEQYLISKKLPLDILLEVKDHMILQIEDLMNAENLSFDDGFSKVETSWKANFELTKYWVFYGREKIPKIAKSIMKEKYTLLLLKSFSLAAVFFGLSIMLISYVDDVESYKLFFGIGHSILLVIPIFLYLSHFKNRVYFGKNFKYKGQINYTLYQQNITLLMICFFGLSQIVLEGGEQIFQSFENDFNSSILSVILLSFYRIFLYAFGIFGVFNFFEHKKALKKLQILN